MKASICGIRPVNGELAATLRLVDSVPAATGTVWRTRLPISLRVLGRWLAAWWADDSMSARFEQARGRDQQLLDRY